jgi:hypothetical protein
MRSQISEEATHKVWEYRCVHHVHGPKKRIFELGLHDILESLPE